MNEDSNKIESGVEQIAVDATENMSDTNIDIVSVLPNPTLPYYEAEVNAVHESIQDAMNLLQKYSEDFEIMKTNPDLVYDNLDQARKRIASAMDILKKTVNSTDQMLDPTNVSLPEQEQIRFAYLNMVTDAFADVLDDLRSKDAGKDADSVVDLDILADCLQSGYDMLAMLGQNDSTSWSEQDFLWNDENDDWMNDSAADLTPHEQHRQELGFQLIN